MTHLTINEWAAPCGCVVRYRFDAHEPMETRKHTATDVGLDGAPWTGRVGCKTHHHDDPHVHYRNLRFHHFEEGKKRDPEGVAKWKLVVEEDGGIRDVLKA